MARTSVVLPEPLPPMRATVSPGATSNETPWSTGVPPSATWTSAARGAAG